jgi:hypothetical protein
LKAMRPEANRSLVWGCAAAAQGLTLVPISAQLELFCPPYNPASHMNVSWICSN